MNDKDEEKVPADGYIRVPKHKWYQIGDALTRQDELMEAILEVLGSVNEKLAEWPELPELSKEEYKETIKEGLKEGIEEIEIRPEVTLPPEAMEEMVEAIKEIELKPKVTLSPEAIEKLAEAVKIEKPSGLPITEKDDLTTNSTSFKSVVGWRVGEVWEIHKDGFLEEVSLVSDNYDKTEFRLILANKKRLEDTIPARLDMGPEVEVDEGDRIEVWARSTDGTEVTATGIIIGREWE